MFRPTPPNDWHTLPGLVCPNWRDDKPLIRTFTLTWPVLLNVKSKKKNLPAGFFLFPLRWNPHLFLLQPPAEEKHCGYSVASAVASLASQVREFALTISDPGSADCFEPRPSVLVSSVAPLRRLDSATAIWLPTLALFWIRAMSVRVKYYSMNQWTV